jgi:hypothetical protein
MKNRAEIGERRNDLDASLSIAVSILAVIAGSVNKIE